MHDPIAPLEVLATNDMFCDPAIDPSDPDEGPSGEERLAAYRKSRDVKDLVLRADVLPTRFVAKPLPPAFAAGALDNMTPAGRKSLAFTASCHEIRLPDGSTLKPRQGSIKPASHGTRCADDEWINLVAERFGLETVYEVGRVAHERARLPRDARGPFSWWGA